MKIVIIGPGIMPIPPKGWGAVEILIWDYKCELEKLGHKVEIVNTPNREEMVNQCNSFNPDFVHIQYDEYWHIIPDLNCKNIAITSHYGYIEQMGKPFTKCYEHVLDGFKKIYNQCYFFCLSKGIKDTYIQHGIPENRMFITPNGARNDLFRYDKNCKFNDKSIYVGKIENRKRQNLIQSYNANVDFAGNYQDSNFNTNDIHYLGEWNKEHLYDNLTNYANLVLLSDGEADPLVTKEALMSGLGLVVSEYACANLDLNLPFITVIPENKIHNNEFVKSKIEENKSISVNMREEIRQYAVNNFSWNILVKKYNELVTSLIKDT
jgi:glycosyltransferase involved in cell wall biosynthesis